MQVRSDTGSALNLRRFRLQLSVLKKKNAPPPPSMLSAAVRAKSALEPPVFISTTNPVAARAQKEIAIGRNGEVRYSARSSASVPRKTITTAAAYRAKLSGVNTR